mmetsp:Transcript_23401/g.68331  ORF Transcript_23401/g.68331 Transcript_23401/m.68331 type:complete len:269 (+) Transcript_23401:332-1138(+)
MQSTPSLFKYSGGRCRHYNASGRLRWTGSSKSWTKSEGRCLKGNKMRFVLGKTSRIKNNRHQEWPFASASRRRRMIFFSGALPQPHARFLHRTGCGAPGAAKEPLRIHLQTSKTWGVSVKVAVENLPRSRLFGSGSIEIDELAESASQLAGSLQWRRKQDDCHPMNMNSFPPHRARTSCVASSIMFWVWVELKIQAWRGVSIQRRLALGPQRSSTVPTQAQVHPTDRGSAMAPATVETAALSFSWIALKHTFWTANRASMRIERQCFL